ncbi:MAG: helix-turn-helix domain-containing protein [Catonella sp.]
MVKYLTDNFGYTLRNIRENLKLTQTDVFKGILTRSTWCNYESDIMIPDMITFITLLERMGVSSYRFEFIVPEDVHRFYEWYNSCLLSIENNDWKGLIDKRNKFKLLKQINTKIQYQYRDFIDYIIERFVNKDLSKALYHIKMSLTHTINDIDKIVEDRRLLSIFEGHILTNYYDLLYEMEMTDGTKLYSFYKYYSNRLKDDLIKGKIIPRIAIVLLKHDIKLLSKDIRLKIEHDVLKILVKNYAIREVPEILKYLVEDEMSYGLSKIRSFQRDALVSVFTEYGVCPDFRVELQRVERKKYLLLSDVLRLRRMELGLTIEEAAGDICAVSTYARAETGKNTPSRTTLNLLKERLGLRAVYYSSEVETDDYAILIKNSECRGLAATGRYEEAELRYADLADKLDMTIPINEQIIGFSKLHNSFGNEDDVQKLWKLMFCNEEDFEKRNIFSREELEILSLIVWEKAKTSLAEAIKFLETILKKERGHRGTYYSRTAIIERDLIKLLKNNGEYDKCRKLALRAIEKIFIENEEGLLLDILDFISTIEEDLGNKAEADRICKEMFYISELYEMYDDAKSIKAYYEKIFETNKIWY